MTTDTEGTGLSRLGRLAVLAMAFLSVAAIAGVVLFSGQSRDDAATIIRTASLPVSQVPPGQILDRAEDLTAWALDAAHIASAAPDADARARQTARFASGAAATALAEGIIAADGLETAETGFHEAEILSASAVRDGDTVRIEATWRPVSLLPGEDHMHQLGNRFTGRIALTWQDRSWRLTSIAVDDIDTTEAGRIVAAPRE